MKDDLIAARVGYVFNLFSAEALSHIALEEEKQNVIVDGVTFSLHAGATLQDSRELDKLLDSRGEMRIDDYVVPRHSCPKCGGGRFYAKAHVSQDWIVDGLGCFIEAKTDCVDVLHSPDDDDAWQCVACGYECAGGDMRLKRSEEG